MAEHCVVTFGRVCVHAHVVCFAPEMVLPGAPPPGVSRYP